ncbi:MAG TPA: hypothetical protein VLN59_06245 [Burkholderiales bacterium]|nr:hypothetical protein [Burkholderiales bacterium]
MSRPFFVLRNGLIESGFVVDVADGADALSLSRVQVDNETPAA